jgi:hypothetical protein
VILGPAAQVAEVLVRQLVDLEEGAELDERDAFLRQKAEQPVEGLPV